MAGVFWDAKVIILTDYPKNDKRIIVEYYAYLLDQLIKNSWDQTSIAKENF